MTIPKIFFTYWEGNQLSVLHYYTIASILKQNPDIDVIIYTSKVDSNILVQWSTHEHKDKFNKIIPLESLVNIDKNRVKLVPVDFVKEYDINNDLSCVFKADFIRISKLYEHGGAWFDMDILFMKSFPTLFFENDLDFYYFKYSTSDVIPSGLFLSSPKNELITAIFNEAHMLIKTPHFLDDYQKIGPILWTKHLNINYESCKKVELSETYVYPYNWKTINLFFENTTRDYIKDDTFCIHWYNGADCSKKFLEKFDTYNINTARSLCDILLSELGPPSLM
jgi:hypothetical protein